MPISKSDLVRWSCDLSLKGSASASMLLTNQNDQYDATLLWSTVIIDLDAETVLTDISDTYGCFEGLVSWFGGVVESVRDTEEISEGLLELKLRSYFSRLAKKPVNTVLYVSNGLIVLTELFTVFGSTPPALIDFSGLTNSNIFIGVVSGNNLLEEADKVAQASEADLFVQRGGKIVAEHWKDHTSSVDVVIPRELILRTEKSRSLSTGPSRLLVRGRFISQYDCGEQVLSRQDNDDAYKPADGKEPKDQGKVKKVIVNSLSLAQTELVIFNLKGNKDDLLNAASEEDDKKIQKILNAEDGILKFLVTGVAGSILPPGTNIFNVDVRGRIRHPREYTDPNSRQKPLSRNQAALGATAVSNLRGARSRGLTPADSNNDKFGDEKEPMQIEMQIDHLGLQGEFGIVTDQIENQYISDYETLFDVGVRRFQEFFMQRNSWEIETKYMTCLKLNQVVEFTTIDRGQVIKGLLTDISVDYSAGEPSANMKLTVQSFEELGNTTYVSGNLIFYSEMCGANNQEFGGWVDSPPGKVRFLDGYCVLLELQSIRQSFNMEPGQEYSISFDVIYHSGSSLTFTVSDSGGAYVSYTYSSTSSPTIVFTPDEIVNTLKWESAGKWYFRRPVLRKKVVG